MAIPVIIDCDPGIDDVMALLLAFVRPELDVRLITTEAGNQTQDKTSFNARGFADLMKQKIEVARGLEQPLMRTLEVAGHVHGDTGLGSLTLDEPVTKESRRSAIDALRETILESPEETVLVATGPLTNIGALFLAHPEVKAHIRYISFMGGAAVGGNVTPTAEFNVYTDPEAADLVFRSGVPIVMSGLDVTHKAYMTEQDLQAIEAIGTPLAREIIAMLKFYGKAAQQTPFHEPHFADVIRLHDLCAVAYAIKPELFAGMDCHVEIETEGRLTSGTTVVDYTNRTKKPANAHVLHSVDREAFVRLFTDAVREAGG
ncbi:nucleoside hydrolase [Indiicoccus explosivorum]|uniref:nucleoside hydrolase n=1 Tax=Indiicoccus explosivorum TaxID=1917864 RepID=UPI001F4E79A1|nr:nucleoside hydrolase [Indiicoccus explosivorum]